MDEFSGAALDDPQLTKRLIRLVDDLSAAPTKSDLRELLDHAAEWRTTWLMAKRQPPLPKRHPP
jgi:hypothetical protein